MIRFNQVILASVAAALAVSPAAAQQYGPQPYQQPYQQQPAYGQPAYPAQQTYQGAPNQPAIGGLGSIFNCQAGGNRQGSGAIIGALAGGIVGNQVADEKRGLGTVLGAALGAAAGSYIGCRMQVGDQQRAQAMAQAALDQGRSQVWSDPQTGGTGRTDIVNTFYQPAPPQARMTPEGIPYAPGVERPREYQPSEGVYTANGAVNMRTGPSQRAPLAGSLRTGERIEGLVRVDGSPWVLAVRDGMAVGYVSETNLRFVGAVTQAAAPQGPMCRTFDQTFQPRGGAPETQRYTACRDQGGQWVIQA